MKSGWDTGAMTRRECLAALGMGAAGCWVYGAETVSPTDSPAPPHEAAFYDKLPDGVVKCRLCPKGCRVIDGRRGWCRVRENRGGRYYSLVYGRACTTHIDPIEKKPFFHVYPGSQAFSIATVGCNFECKFCQNWDISQANIEDVPAPYRSPETIARMAAQAGVKAIAYTYSEPNIFYEYMVDCAKAGRDAGVESVVVSNGFLTADAQRALFPLVKAVKIDFKAFSESFYSDVCSGALQPVLDSLKRLAQSGVWYEIVVLLIPGMNDSPDDLKRMSAWIVKECSPDVPVHFSRFSPMYKMRNIAPTPTETLDRAWEIAVAEGCRFVYIGNVPGSDKESTVCPACKAVVVKRYGYRILDNRIANGKCKACGAAIPGVWM